MERSKKLKQIFAKLRKVIFSFWIPVFISIMLAAFMVLVAKKTPAEEFGSKVWYFFCKSFFPCLPAMMYVISK